MVMEQETHPFPIALNGFFVLLKYGGEMVSTGCRRLFVQGRGQRRSL